MRQGAAAVEAARCFGCGLRGSYWGLCLDRLLLPDGCARFRLRDSDYNLLVRGFRDGQLNLKREAPPGLVNPNNPADVDLSKMFGLTDLSYYKGKLYLYFGATPALALFWPCVALTGHYLSQAVRW